MNKWLESSLGLSPAALIRGVRSGPREMVRAARRSFATASPFNHNRGHLGLSGLPEIALDQILGDRKVPITLQVMAYEDGMLPIRDALPLLSIAVMEQPERVVEIGTFMGHTTRALAQNVPAAIVHTIDLPADFSPTAVLSSAAIPKDDFHLIARRRVGREFKNSEYESRIVQHFADTAEMDFRTLGHASFFFIDGSHTYEYCKNDSEKCLLISSSEATFLWHDCDLYHPGVIRCLGEWRALGRDVAVIAGTSLAYWRRP